jgi:hypothetical protein
MAYYSAITGLNLQVLTPGPSANTGVVRVLLYGTYTAADFYLLLSDIGFKPSKVRVLNTTDGTVGEWYLDDTTNLVNSGYTQVAAGTKTMVAKGSAGVTYADGKLQFDVDACCPITDSDEVIVELYRG